MVQTRRSGFLHKLGTYFKEYCNKTTLHGFQYFGEKKRTICERIWWLFTITVCVALSVYIILTMYYQYKVSPIIVTLATKTKPIHKIPFPAITICPQSKSDARKLNFSTLEQSLSSDGNYTEQDFRNYQYASLICDREIFMKFYDNDFEIVNSTDFYKTIYEIKPDFLGGSLCRWLGSAEYVVCSDLFTEIITTEGICYTFNLIDRTEMFREETYNLNDIYTEFNNAKKSVHHWMDNGEYSSNKTNSYPYTASLPGVRNSLVVTMFANSDESDYTCSGYLQGYKVAFHIPESYPSLQEDHIFLPLDQFVTASVQPNMVTTSVTVQNYDAHVRMCYTPQEKYLRYFKIYTQNNCRIECLTNYTMKNCNCVAFYMPHSNNTTICGTVFQGVCVDMATKIMQEEATKQADSEVCDCLPLCSDLEYDITTSQAVLKSSKFYNNMFGDVQDTSNLHYSMLRVYFKSDRFITSQRNELYGPIGFVANFGGIIALFTGASIMSVVEIFYFLTCRLICNIRLFGSAHWAGRVE